MKRYLPIAVLVVMVDVLTKHWAQGLEGPVVLLPGVIGLRYAENTGMAFSLLSGQTWLLGIMSLLCVLVGWLLLRRYRLGALSCTAAMLMLGGALGNALDRLFRGYVVDMLEVLFMRFAIFNVADMALTVGCALMAMSLLRCPDEWERRVAQPKENSEKQKQEGSSS